MVSPDLRNSAEHDVAIAGEGVDRDFRFYTVQVSIVGPDPSVEVSGGSRPGADLLVSAQRFQAGSEATITLASASVEISVATVRDDGSFATGVTSESESEVAVPSSDPDSGGPPWGLLLAIFRLILLVLAVGPVGIEPTTKRL